MEDIGSWYDLEGWTLSHKMEEKKESYGDKQEEKKGKKEAPKSDYFIGHLMQHMRAQIKSINLDGFEAKDKTLIDDGITKELKKKADKIASLSAELNTKTDAHGTMMKTYPALLEELKTTIAKLNALTSKQQAAEKELTETTAKVNSLPRELNDKTTQMEKLSETHKTTENLLKDAHRKIETLQQEGNDNCFLTMALVSAAAASCVFYLLWDNSRLRAAYIGQQAETAQLWAQHFAELAGLQANDQQQQQLIQGQQQEIQALQQERQGQEQEIQGRMNSQESNPLAGLALPNKALKILVNDCTETKSVEFFERHS